MRFVPIRKSKEPAGLRRYGMDSEDARMIFFCREGADRAA